jgi:hypothetical protein
MYFSFCYSRKLVACNDKVIEQVNTKQLSGCRELFGHRSVFGSWRQIAGRVVMGDDYCYGAMLDGGSEDLTRMYDISWEATDGNDLIVYDRVAAVRV